MSPGEIGRKERKKKKKMGTLFWEEGGNNESGRQAGEMDNDSRKDRLKLQGIRLFFFFF